MKKSVFVLFLFVGLVFSANNVFAENINPKPALTLVEEDSGSKYLIDESGIIYSFLIPLDVRVQFESGGFWISPYILHGPPVKYDGIKITCAGYRVLSYYDELGPHGGIFIPPRYPYEYCFFSGFIIDGEGKKYTTPFVILGYIK